MYHCIEYLYSYGKVFRTIVADNGAIEVNVLQLSNASSSEKDVAVDHQKYVSLFCFG